MLKAALLFAATLICTPNPSHASPPAGHGHAHAPKPGVQSLDVYSARSVIHLLTGETPVGAQIPHLKAQRSNDGGATWTEPVRIDAGLPSPHNARRGMDPQIAASGNNAVAAWMTKGTGLFDSGPIVTVISKDGGRTWTAGPNPADDGSTGGHGFIDIAADEKGIFHIVWLDSRDGKQGLRYARSTDGGLTWSRNETIDPETCECCSNTLAVKSGEVAVLYRDKNPRDMALAVKRGESGWAFKGHAARINWQFDGCPHVGGGAAITNSEHGQTVHALTWTGADGKAGVYYSRAQGAQHEWTEPQMLAVLKATHPDLAATASGRVAAAWSGTGEARGIFVSTSDARGETWEEPARLSTQGAEATHPRVIAHENGFRVFWTETMADGSSRWTSAEVR